MSNKTTFEMKQESEQFYKDAFCADSATVLPPSALGKFKIAGVVKIIRNGQVFFIGALEPN